MTVAVLNANSRAWLEGKLPEGVEPLWFDSVDELMELAPRAQVAWLDMIAPAVAKQAIAGMTDLKWFNAMSSGVDWLPLDVFRTRGVQLTNGAGIHAQTVSEFAVMGMLTMAKGWRAVVRAQDRHEWLKQPPGTRELLDSHVLVIGAGEIGSRIAEMLRVFGAKVTSARRHPKAGELGQDEWQGALGRFDWVILIVPSTPQTTGMFGAAQFAAMKPGATLLNFARGTVIDQDALLAAIDSGHLGGAFLDVTTPEPLPADHPLWSRENVHISMHLSGRSQDARIGAVSRQYRPLSARRTARSPGRSRRGVLRLNGRPGRKSGAARTFSSLLKAAVRPRRSGAGPGRVGAGPKRSPRRRRGGGGP